MFGGSLHGVGGLFWGGFWNSHRRVCIFSFLFFSSEARAPSHLRVCSLSQKKPTLELRGGALFGGGSPTPAPGAAYLPADQRTHGGGEHLPEGAGEEDNGQPHPPRRAVRGHPPLPNGRG